MKTKLITALRTAANALADGIFSYKWTNPYACNCGVLVCSILNKSSAELRQDLLNACMTSEKDHTLNTWKSMLGRHCPITGIPTNVIFRELLNTGLSQKDIINLEELSDGKILSKITMEKTSSAGIGKWDKVDVRCAILYMRTWADILEEEGKLDVCQKSNKSESEPVLI